MGIYFVIETVTREGMMTVDEAPERASGVVAVAARYGVTVTEWYYTAGESDFIMRLEAPDDDAVEVFCMAVRRSGNVTLRTLKAYTPDAWASLVAKI